MCRPSGRPSSSPRAPDRCAHTYTPIFSSAAPANRSPCSATTVRHTDRRRRRDRHAQPQLCSEIGTLALAVGQLEEERASRRRACRSRRPVGSMSSIGTPRTASSRPSRPSRPSMAASRRAGVDGEHEGAPTHARRLQAERRGDGGPERWASGRRAPPRPASTLRAGAPVRAPVWRRRGRCAAAGASDGSRTWRRPRARGRPRRSRAGEGAVCCRRARRALPAENVRCR